MSNETLPSEAGPVTAFPPRDAGDEARIWKERFEEVQHRLEEAEVEVRRWTREHPLASVAAAAMAGYVVARILK